MEKYIYNEKNGLWYEQQGDYFIPCLKLPEEDQESIGIWGRRHLRYVRQNKRLFYMNLLTTGKIGSYLSDIDRQAEDTFSRLVDQMAERENVTETLKSGDQIKWVGRINNICSRATEIINSDIIYN